MAIQKAEWSANDRIVKASRPNNHREPDSVEAWNKYELTLHPGCLLVDLC
jgi:hypothetical protein